MGCVENECLEAFLMVGLMEGGRDHKKRICEIIFGEGEDVYAQR
jgi:hypothetical protein